MIFVWTGRGFLVPLFTIGVVGAFGAVMTYALDPGVFDRESWLYAIGFIMAAVVNWIWGRRIQHRSVRSFAPGPRIKRLSRAKNSFLFVDMEYWSVAMLIAATVIAIRSALA